MSTTIQDLSEKDRKLIRNVFNALSTGTVVGCDSDDEKHRAASIAAQLE